MSEALKLNVIYFYQKHSEIVYIVPVIDSSVAIIVPSSLPACIVNMVPQ